MIVCFDPYLAGVSGNMVVGALLSLNESNKEKIKELAKNISPKLKIKIEKIRKNGFIATYVETYENERLSPKEMEECLKKLNLSRKALGFSLKTLNTFFEAEKKIHGDVTHLHELGSTDTVFDIASTALLADELGFFDRATTIISTPVRVGTGRIKTEHGYIPNPSPATLEIAKTYKIPLKFCDIRAELTTPTGIAILANLVNSFTSELPPVKIKNIGYGAGSFNLPFPNIMRVLICESELKGEHISVLETNVDDVTGEILGYTIEKLYKEGALDVQVLHGITKKNRPSFLISVITKLGDEEKLAKVLMQETGTLGVRIKRMQKRFIFDREIKTITVEISGKKRKVRVKVAYDMDGKPINFKPEYEDLKRIAEEFKISVKQAALAVESKLSDSISD